MKCPHCAIGFSVRWREMALPLREESAPTPDPDSHSWAVVWDQCTECHRYIVRLRRKNLGGMVPVEPGSELLTQEELVDEWQVYPKGQVRPCPTEVPSDLADDFTEACLVLIDSPKASAALSRRCLQHLLRSKAGVKPGRLYDEIEQVLEAGAVPSHVSEMLHAVREIGNLAAHATEETATGEILDVEPAEAEWNLDTLEVLFDFYFVQPARAAERLAGLNEKLASAGKSRPMRSRRPRD